jgi:WD40 repeat protein
VGNPLNRSAGIYKIEFKPSRFSVVPGSIGTGEVWCLAVSSVSGRITLSGKSWALDSTGVFEIDPAAATSMVLAPGTASGCGGKGGFMSPDGKRAITNDAKQLRLVVLRTGASTAIKGTSADTQSVWSPDGRWIATVRGGRIGLIDADDPTRSRGLGRSGDGPLVWSPDSRYLLLRTSPLSCALTVYGESLEVVDVETGGRNEVKSSHCTITAGTLGWLDRRFVR